MENEPFLLVELEDLSTIFSPLKTASRIKSSNILTFSVLEEISRPSLGSYAKEAALPLEKCSCGSHYLQLVYNQHTQYTCFTVSNNFLIFGATSGGIYVFRREPCCFLQLLPNKEGSITQVAISPDEKLIAFSTVKGIVCIMERSHSAKHLVMTSEHQNEQITCLQWNEGNNELFVGDNSGKVSIVTISIFPTKTMFQTPSFVLMQLDSKVVQMDFCSNMLLVSTLTKCYICDTAKEIFRQVGHKLRDGEYGACIFNTQSDHDVDSDTEKTSEYPNLSHLKLLCARPGSRVWEVAIDGTVISTHHFKEALAVPPRKIYFLNKSSSQSSDINNSIVTNGSCVNTEHNFNFVEQSFNFQKLYILLSKFFFTFKSDGIYVFDPQKASVVLWNNEITNIVDVKCVNDVIYVWSGFGKVYALNFVPLEKLLVRLYFQKKYAEIANLCLEFEGVLLSQANNCNKLYILHDLDDKLKSQGLENISERLKPLIAIYKEKAQKRKTQNAQILKSGIYLVNNDHSEDRRMTKQKMLRPNYLNLKGRSHSVSPERLQNGKLKQQGSSSSLPDLIKERQPEENSDNSVTMPVVNGKEEKETKVAPKLDVEGILKVCEIIKQSEPSKEFVFSLFDQILALSAGKSETHSLESIQSLPLNSYFNETDVRLISDLFHSSLKSKLMFKWLSKFNGDWVTNSVKNYPDFLVKNHSMSSLELDFKLSKILEMFSCLLNENEIVDIVKNTEMECYYASLLKILDVYHDSASLSVSNLNLGNLTSIPKILNVAYFLMNVGQIEQCSKYSYKIPIQDMFYLMLKFEESSIKAGKSTEIIELQSHTLFLSYLDKAPTSELLNNCSDLLKNYIVNCLENINCTASCVRESNCSCGFPCPGLQPSIRMFPDVGHALIDKTWPKNPTKCLEICSRVPYLWKYFIFIRKNDPLEDLLPLLLQLGDMQELDNRSNDFSEQILEKSIIFLDKLKKGFCLNCNAKIKTENSLTWTEFGLLCVKFLGPRETLALFEKHEAEIPSKELHQTFYQGLIFSAIMEKYSKGLKKSVVDLLLGRGRHESSRISVLSEKVKKEIFGKDHEEKFNSSNASDSHHWGVKVNFKENCAVCSLPLDTKVLISEAGLVVFKCAHAFHSACLRKANLECPLCKNKTNGG